MEINILLYHWVLALLIRWTKSNQFQSKTFHIPLPRLRGNPLCPVQAIVNFMQLSIGACPDGSALANRFKHRSKALTYDRFVTRVRQCFTACSLAFASLSFRRGGASHCYAIGLSSESIKPIGYWSSFCYLQYIENDFQSKFNILSQMHKYVKKSYQQPTSSPFVVFGAYFCSWCAPILVCSSKYCTCCIFIRMLVFMHILCNSVYFCTYFVNALLL